MLESDTPRELLKIYEKLDCKTYDLKMANVDDIDHRETDDTSAVGYILGVAKGLNQLQGKQEVPEPIYGTAVRQGPDEYCTFCC